MRDLPLADSTSFLFTFKDNSGILKTDVVVETLRKYISDGAYRIIEREKVDDSGKTSLHLIEEDAIYIFKIYENEVLIYTSNPYKAICESSPCELSLFEGGLIDDFNEDLDNVEGSYTYDTDATTRTVTVDFSLSSIETMNLTLYAINDTSQSLILIASDALEASSGSLEVVVPQSYGNRSFFTTLQKTNDTDIDLLIDSSWIDLKYSLLDQLGSEYHAEVWLLSGLVVLAVSLTAISSGAGVIIFALIALVGLGFLLMLNTYVAVISLIVGGVILLFKIIRRDR